MLGHTRGAADLWREEGQGTTGNGRRAEASLIDLVFERLNTRDAQSGRSPPSAHMSFSKLFPSLCLGLRVPRGLGRDCHGEHSFVMFPKPESLTAPLHF